jgi:hypothetical protein
MHPAAAGVPLALRAGMGTRKSSMPVTLVAATMSLG